jgi:hypothetical protein
MPVLTKAGGFGEPESLLRCLEFLTDLDRGIAVDNVRSKGPQ